MSTTVVWTTIAALTLTTAAIKGIGPAALGGRELPPRMAGVIVLLPAPLLAALVVTQTLAHEQELQVGAHTVGVAVGAALFWRWRSMLAAGIVAAVVTAGLRALTS